jgi:hypothetical protein
MPPCGIQHQFQICWLPALTMDLSLSATKATQYSWNMLASPPVKMSQAKMSYPYLPGNQLCPYLLGLMSQNNELGYKDMAVIWVTSSPKIQVCSQSQSSHRFRRGKSSKLHTLVTGLPLWSKQSRPSKSHLTAEPGDWNAAFGFVHFLSYLSVWPWDNVLICSNLGLFM